MAFDRPFFGAHVLMPVAVAGVLAGVVVGVLRLAWYWAILIGVLSLVMVICRERR